MQAMYTEPRSDHHSCLCFMQVVSLYKGKQTSANLPYKVTFIIPQEGAKDIKLVAHLVSVHDYSDQPLPDGQEHAKRIAEGLS